MRSFRISAAAAFLALSVAATLLTPAGTRSPGAAASAATTLRATIHRTSHGIPHIVAKTWKGLGFGQGYATAETSICVLADTLMTVRGERSKFLGPDGRYTDQVTLNATNLESDVFFRNIRNREVVRDLLGDPDRGPGRQTRRMVAGYVEGVNQYLRDIGGRNNIPDPTCRGKKWVRPATAVDLWHGIYAANLLASSGFFVPQIVNAEPPTPTPFPSGGDSRFAQVPAELPSAEELQRRLGKGEQPFGSNGTALGSRATTTGRGMLLGNPHFPWRGRYRFVQAHLTIPGKYDVAGGMLIGSPVVNIGWNKDVAWTHTVSTAFRFTPYEYRTVPGSSTTYVTEEGVEEVDRQVVTVAVRQPDGSIKNVNEDVYRTDEGYVLDAPSVLMPWTPASFFALRDANAEHLKTVDVFHEMAKARGVLELLAAHDRTGGMPWVNTMAASRHGRALYADHSVVPNVPDALARKCNTPTGRVLFELAGLPALDGTRADDECAWREDIDAPRPGIFGPQHLPDTIRKDWVINANDSYWLPNPKERLEGFARIIGCERCERSLRTRMVYRYVQDRLAGRSGPGRRFTRGRLQGTEHANRVFAAELARQDNDLNEVCEAAEGGRACTVLRNWDGRTNTDSVGAHIFREFWVRTPRDRWEVAFDPQRPVTTPRDLKENDPRDVQAMRAAISYLKDKGVALNAELGDLQVAGDEGAPPIPIGGGLHDTGNANVVVTRNPAVNKKFLYPISYGSSHIQAVAFRDDGPHAATILTYGLSVNPRSPWSKDQTRLFSKERWVEFPWKRADILADPNHTSKVVRLRR